MGSFFPVEKFLDAGDLDKNRKTGACGEGTDDAEGKTKSDHLGISEDDIRGFPMTGAA